MPEFFSSSQFTELTTETVSKIAAKSLRFVLAESCTAGMIASVFGRVPGVSECFCGSSVTYRESAKTDWLQVDRSILSNHSDVSQPVTDEMALGVLRATAEADLAMAITGHLGPIAEATESAIRALDGHCFLAMATRQSNKIELIDRMHFVLANHRRLDRQIEATQRAIRFLKHGIESI